MRTPPPFPSRRHGAYHSTSLRDRSRTPSPSGMGSRRPVHKDYYDRSRRSPSPSTVTEDEDRHPYSSGPIRRHLPGATQLPYLSRSPTVQDGPNRPGIRLPTTRLTEPGPMGFPRLCPSPSAAYYYDQESSGLDYESAVTPTHEEDVTEVDHRRPARGTRALPRVPPHYGDRRNSPPVIDHIQMSPPQPLYYRARSTDHRQTHRGPVPNNNHVYYPASPGSRKLPEPVTTTADIIAASGPMYVGRRTTDRRPPLPNGTGQLGPAPQAPSVIRAQPGNIPLSDSEQEDWC